MTATNIYEALDAAILAAIAGGKRYFHTMVNGEVKARAVEVANRTRREAYRVLDARLQALRRAGRIEYRMAKGWSVKEQK